MGLINAKLSYVSGNSTSIVEGTSFAIPGTLAISIAKSIINNNGFPSKIELGIDFDNLATNISVSSIENSLITDYEVRITNIDSNFFESNLPKIEDVVLSFSYYDLNGDLQEVYMSNKYCFEDVAFDIMFNSDIKFNIIRPITDENITLTVKANHKCIQK